MKSISRMYYLIINKNLDPPCKIISKTHFFLEKREREREENDVYRSQFNQVTISTTLPSSLPLLLRSFHGDDASIQNDRTWKQFEGDYW